MLMRKQTLLMSAIIGAAFVLVSCNNRNSAGPNIIDEELVSIIERDDVKSLESYIRKNIDVNRQINMMNLLEISMQEDSKKSFKFLLEKGAFSWAADATIVFHGNRDMFDIYVKFVEDSSMRETTPLWQNWFYFNHMPVNGSTSLHIATRLNNDIYFLKKLLERAGTSNLNARDGRGNIPLHYAIEKKFVEKAKLLLVAGSDPDIVGARGKSSKDLARNGGIYQDLFEE